MSYSLYIVSEGEIANRRILFTLFRQYYAFFECVVYASWTNILKQLFRPHTHSWSMIVSMHCHN